MASTKTPKNYRPEFKAKVALEAVRSKLTISELSKQFSVHPTQIAKWKKQFLENLPQFLIMRESRKLNRMKSLSINYTAKSDR